MAFSTNHIHEIQVNPDQEYHVIIIYKESYFGDLIFQSFTCVLREVSLPHQKMVPLFFMSGIKLL